MMTPIHYLRDDEDGDPKRLDVRKDSLTVWFPEGADEGVDPEWTRDRIRRHEDDVDEWGQPLPEMIAAARAERVLDAVEAGRRSVDLDVSAVVADVAWQLRADARAERRWGHPSLSAAERG
jgi:hypothetical protein